jgi:hypothetical protein
MMVDEGSMAAAGTGMSDLDMVTSMDGGDDIHR